MARLPRLSIGGLPHLLVQRGHNRQHVFMDATDRTLFRALLDEAARAEQVLLHAYALMDNEVRLLLTPPEAQSLGRMMQILGRRYGGAFNRRHGRTGGLWEGRFRATVVEPERHLLEAMRYVEEDASWPGGSAEAEAPSASSRAHHLGKGRDGLLTDPAVYWSLGNTPFDREASYRELLREGLTSTQRERVEASVLKAWPLGSDAFLAELASKTERRLVPLKRGRPRK